MEPHERVDEILGAWREEAERGHLVDPDALGARYPDLADGLRERFEAQSLVDRFFAEEDALPFVCPERLGDYRILGEIGRGGMGVVYEAEQESMGRRVALKVLYPTIATTVQTRKRFEREARITGRLHHTNIVTVHGMGREGGYIYFAMELVEGQPLDRVIAHLTSIAAGDPGRVTLEGFAAALRGRDRWRHIARMAAGVADALHVAHESEVIHRDVKPSNLVLDEEGALKLTDFGLAHLAGEDFGVTRTGEVIGTPLYMSPEQVRARRGQLDHRTDIYSLGATLYELISLDRPFDAHDVGTLCAQILGAEPTPLRQTVPGLPRDLATIVHKAMRKERSDRYASAGTLAADLRAFAEGRPIRARPLGVVQRAWRRAKRHPVRSALATAVLALGVLGLWLKVQTDRARDETTSANYETLLLRAYGSAGALSTPYASMLDEDGIPSRDSAAADAFGQAIALRAGRPDAWLGRALLADRPTEQRLHDLDEARARGLRERTYRVARAYVLLECRRQAEALAEYERAGDAGTPATLDDVLDGAFLTRQGRHEEARARLDRAVDRAPQGQYLRWLALMTRGRAHMTAGRWPAAVQDFAAVVEAGGRDPGAGIRLADAWLRLGERDQAERIFTRALETARRRYGLQDWRTLRWVAYALRRDAWIHRIAEAALAAFPGRLRVRLWHAESLAEQGRFQEALAISEAVQRQAGTAGPVPAHVRRKHAHVLWLAGRLDEAEHVLRALAEAAPASALDVLNHAVLLHALGRNAEAEAVLRHTIAQAPYAIIPHAALAGVLAAQGEHLDEALALARRMQAIAPHYPGTHRTLANVHMARGDHAAALDAIDRAIAIRGPHPRLRASRAAYLNNLGRFQEALETTADLAASRTAAYVRGYACEGLGRLEEALDAYERAVTPAGASCRDDLAQARVLRRLGRPVEAAAALERALGHVSPTVPDLLTRAEELLYQGRFELAARDAAAAASRAPHDPRAPAVRGEALLQKRKPDEALAVVEQALGRGVDSAQLQRVRGRALIVLQRYAQAIGVFDAILAEASSPLDRAYRAGGLLESGRPEEGFAELQRANEAAPEDSLIAGWYAQLLMDRGRQAEALPILERVPAAARTAPERELLARLLFNAARYEDFLAALDGIRGPGGPPPDLVLGEVKALVLVGRHEDAVRRVTEALPAMAPEQRADLHGWRGAALANLGRHAQAVADYEALLAQDGPSLRAYRLLAQSQMFAGQIDAADATLAAAEGHLGQLPELRIQRLFVLFRGGRLAQAVRYGSSVGSQEMHFHAMHLLALRALGAKSTARARAVELRRSLGRAPQPGLGLDALLCAAAGARDEALAILAVRRAEDAARAGDAWARAAAHAMLGQKAAAIAETVRYMQRLEREPCVMPPDPALAPWRDAPAVAAWFKRWEQQVRAGAK